MIRSSKAKISEFFSVCAYLISESGIIIRDVRKSNNLEKVMKGKDDPMTIADLKSQALIEKGLRHFWPAIKIIGEETLTYEEEVNLDLSSINKDLFPPEIYQNEILNNEFDLEDTIVWVDPLDGTLSYTKNELDAVCTLIGVSHKNRPIMGLVCQHYEKVKDNEYIYNPKIYFGHANMFGIHYIYGNEIAKSPGSLIPWNFKVEKKNRNADNFIVCTSQNRMSERTISRIKELNGFIKSMGGAGKKILDVVEGGSDCYLYDQKGTKKWDTCAGEALLLSLGGVLSDIKGQEYIYNEKEDNFMNTDGIIAMMDRKKYYEVLEFTKKYEK